MERVKTRFRSPWCASQIFHVKSQIVELRDKMHAVITRPTYSLPFLQPGRVVKVVDGADDWGWRAEPHSPPLAARRRPTRAQPRAVAPVPLAR